MTDKWMMPVHTGGIVQGEVVVTGSNGNLESIPMSEISGSPGPAGPEGPQGPPGVDGAQGLQGIQGVPGADGAPGPQGIQGIPGADGAQGPQGIQGIPGPQGIQGIQGEQGPAGPTGDVSGAWPIGSVFISVVPTNPGTLLGTGTWVAFGSGRVLVGIDAGQSEFDTAEKTGGAKTHTLTTPELPGHTHPQVAPTSASGGARRFAADTNASGAVEDVNPTGSTGGGGAHNNLQPYIVCYFWKRTA